MADSKGPSSAVESNVGARPRRLSLRKSPNDCGLPPGYLDALETKRKALDESIHKFIASKEREYKQYEKELRHQARRAEQNNHEQHASLPSADAISQSSPSAVDTLLQHSLASGESATSRHVSENANPVSSTSHDDQQLEDLRKQEDFQGVFTPEYLVALQHHERERSASEPVAVPPSDDSTTKGLIRNNSDTPALVDHINSARLKLNHRTSSSGSSIDSRLISAMKSLTSEPSQPKRKRVSIAVGNSIVAPSDNVPAALHVKSSSSHSRPRTPKRDRHAFIEDSIPAQDPKLSSSVTSNTLETTGQQGSVSPAISMLEPTIPLTSTPQIEDDVGDLFDLEEAEFDEIGVAQLSDDAASSQDSLPDIISGRVSSSTPPLKMSTSPDTDLHIQPGELPLRVDDDEMQDVPLTPITGVAASKQPADPGFRRPSVLVDPIYRGRSSEQTSRTVDDDEVYSSSFSRPTNKGSFTSGSLGESYMAKNAEAMMNLRTQQQKQDNRHRTSHSHTVLPVR